MNVSKLEPAERNPKRELATLVITLVLALAAGGLIFYNYTTTRMKQAEEQKKGKAPMIGELTKNYSFKNKSDENASFFDSTGYVTLVACVAVNQLEDSKLVTDSLKQFEETYKDEPRVRFLLLSMDDEREFNADQVVPVLEKTGLAGEKWDVAMSNGNEFLKYIKKQLKFHSLSDKKNEGKWRVPLRVRILGPDLKIRGKDEEYDFGKFLYDQEKAKNDPELLNSPKFQNDPRFKGDPEKIDLVQWGIDTMKTNINYMLENEEFDKEVIDASKKKNIYKPYLWLFGGFGLFLLILWMKFRRNRSAAAK